MSEEWARLGSVLDREGYWPEADLEMAVRLTGVPICGTIINEDEDVYRLSVWAFQCEPDPEQALIERLKAPERRPPGLRDVETEVLCRRPRSAWRG